MNTYLTVALIYIVVCGLCDLIDNHNKKPTNKNNDYIIFMVSYLLVGFLWPLVTVYAILYITAKYFYAASGGYK